jgi:hypothetical protein
VRHEDGLRPREPRDDPGDHLRMPPISDHGPGPRRQRDRAKGREGMNGPPRVPEAGLRQLDDLGAERPQTTRQIAIAETKRDDQTSAPQLFAGAEQIQ